MDDSPYTSPVITDYGSLTELTADIDSLNFSAGALRSVASLAVLSSPTTLLPSETGDGGALGSSGGGGGGSSSPTTDLSDPGAGGVLGEALADGGTGDSGDTAGDGASGGTSGGSGGISGSGGGGGGDGRLPFTGFAVTGLALLGASLGAAGLTLRSHLRRMR